MVPDWVPGACELTVTHVRQPVPSGVGRVSHGWPQPPGSSQPPATAFCPASQVAANSPPAPAPTDHGAVFTVISPAAVLAGPGALDAWASACETACWTMAAAF